MIILNKTSMIRLSAMLLQIMT